MKIVLLILFFTSCSNLSYLSEQAIGQLSIQTRGQDNEEVLNDPEVPEEHKKKIRLIKKYKSYFYDALKKTPNSIYSKTTLLNDKAVSYLLIASKPTRIQAKTFRFPVVGEFPYIGFFKLSSAKSYAKKLKKEGYVTWIRPVYAYSTLGYLEDRILSSFFVYNDFELAELIFHELFHTIFFVSNEVALNENLANYFSRLMVRDYFRDEKARLFHFYERLKDEESLKILLVGRIVTLNKKLKEKKYSRKKAQKIVDDYVKKSIMPLLERYCKKQKVCYNKFTWNQASMAAFLTYERKQNFLNSLLSDDLSPKENLDYLEKLYQAYKKGPQNSFYQFLKERL